MSIPSFSPPKYSPRSAVLILGAFAGCGYYVFTHPNTREFNPTSFTPCRILSREPVSSTSSILTLQSSLGLASLKTKFNHPTLWSLEAKQPQLQIARSYTPLPPLDSASQLDDNLRFLVRREKQGEVSNYLHRRQIGEDVELRGPTDDYTLPDHVSQVVFLAGGTGIAPALQVAHSLQDKARIGILWANRTREDCRGGHSDNPLSSRPWYLSIWGGQPSHQPENAPVHPIVNHLQSLKATSHGKLQVDYCVDAESSYITPKRIEQLMLRDGPATPGSKVIIVSGPEGFINHWAGPKTWANGRQVQGPLGGQLARMNLQGWQVVKL